MYAMWTYEVLHVYSMYEPPILKALCYSTTNTDMIEICNNIMFAFYPGLLHVYKGEWDGFSHSLVEGHVHIHVIWVWTKLLESHRATF